MEYILIGAWLNASASSLSSTITNHGLSRAIAIALFFSFIEIMIIAYSYIG